MFVSLELGRIQIRVAKFWGWIRIFFFCNTAFQSYNDVQLQDGAASVDGQVRATDSKLPVKAEHIGRIKTEVIVDESPPVTTPVVAEVTPAPGPISILRNSITEEYSKVGPVYSVSTRVKEIIVTRKGHL